MEIKRLLFLLGVFPYLGTLATEIAEHTFESSPRCENNRISKGVYRSLVARSKIECHIFCQEDRKCLSVNVCDNRDRAVTCSLSYIRMEECHGQEQQDGCSYRIMKGATDDRCGSGFDGHLCSNFAVQSCKDVQDCSNEELPDGEYWIYPVGLQGRRVKIYCHNMSTDSPTEYVTLPEKNIVIYPPRKMTGKADCSTVEDWSLRKHGTTRFNKIRIQIKTMQVVRSDFTFSSTTGNRRNFGAATDCVYNTDTLSSCRKLGTMTINTRGSGLLVNRTLQWKVRGHKGRRDSLERSADGRKITAVCGGWCGGCRPDGPMTLQLDSTAPPDSSAKHCASLYYRG